MLALGLACVLIGAWLTVKPFDSLSVLVWLIAAAFVVSGVAEVASAESTARPWLSRIVGLGWIVAGVLVAAWPAITVTALTIAVGIALVAGGAAKVFAALSESGDERFVLATVGLASVVFGVLALSWPAVTVLVLAVVFGVRTIVFGLGQIALAMRMRRANVDGSDPAAVERAALADMAADDRCRRRPGGSAGAAGRQRRRPPGATGRPGPVLHGARATA